MTACWVFCPLALPPSCLVFLTHSMICSQYLPTPRLTTFLPLYLMLFLLTNVPSSSNFIWRNFWGTTQMPYSLMDTGVSSSDPSKYLIAFTMTTLCYGHCLSHSFPFFLPPSLPPSLFLPFFIKFTEQPSCTKHLSSQWLTSTPILHSAPFSDSSLCKVHPLGLPDLPNWQARCLVKFEFQINNE